jgi:hypothetical protein
MNLFNRIVLVVILVALAAGGIAVAVLTWTLPNESIEKLGDAVQWLSDNNQELERALVAAVALLISVIAIALLLFELVPRNWTEVKVTDVQTGDAYLSTASIGQRIEEAVSRVPHVSDVRALVKAKRKGVQVSLDLHVEPQANLATVTDAANEAARDVLTNQVHVALVEPPHARLHYRELVLSRARRQTGLLALEAGRPVTEQSSTPPAPAMVEKPPETPVEERELVATAVTAGGGLETSDGNAASGDDGKAAPGEDGNAAPGDTPRRENE